MAPSPGRHLQCTHCDVSGRTVQPENYSSVCVYKWRTRILCDCCLKLKTVWLLKQPKRFPQYTRGFINQTFLMVLVTCIMYNCYFSWFCDRSSFMNRQSYLLFGHLHWWICFWLMKNVHINICTANIATFYYVIWLYKMTMTNVFFTNYQAASLCIAHNFMLQHVMNCLYFWGREEMLSTSFQIVL